MDRVDALDRRSSGDSTTSAVERRSALSSTRSATTPKPASGCRLQIDRPRFGIAFASPSSFRHAPTAALTNHCNRARRFPSRAPLSVGFCWPQMVGDWPIRRGGAVDPVGSCQHGKLPSLPTERPAGSTVQQVEQNVWLHNRAQQPRIQLSQPETARKPNSAPCNVGLRPRSRCAAHCDYSSVASPKVDAVATSWQQMVMHPKPSVHPRPSVADRGTVASALQRGWRSSRVGRKAAGRRAARKAATKMKRHCRRMLRMEYGADVRDVAQ